MVVPGLVLLERGSRTGRSSLRSAGWAAGGERYHGVMGEVMLARS